LGGAIEGCDTLVFGSLVAEMGDMLLAGGLPPRVPSPLFWDLRLALAVRPEHVT
jgi:hypothetical protein